MTREIVRLGHLGDGIAGDGTLVAGVLPGEVVDGVLENGRIAAPKIMTPSPDRVRPPCPHAKGCGGCALQHASDGFVADWKVDVVRRALAAQGIEAPFREIVTSPPASRRRAVLAGRRLKSGVLVGFHGRRSDALVAIPGCTVLVPEILAGIPALEEIVAIGGSRKGEVTLAVTVVESGLDIAVRGAKPLDGPLRIALASLADRHDLVRLSWEDETVVTRKPAILRFAGVAVEPPPGVFLQATKAGETALQAAVLDAVGTKGPVADLFAGAGTFSLALAQGMSVHAVEGDAALVAALDQGWRKGTGLRAVSTEVRDLFRRPLMSDEFSRFRAVVLDPPRAGAAAQVDQITGSGVPRVAMVSCNPVSFARDTARLVSGGYKLDWVQVIDQFRWSGHVEIAAQLTRP